MASTRSALRSSAPLFAALGDATRLRIVARLCSGGPQSITRLTEGSDVSRQAVTKHLRVLEGAGVVRGVRHGRESRWALAPEKLEAAQRYLERISHEWNTRLDSLERHLDVMAEREERAAKKRR